MFTRSNPTQSNGNAENAANEPSTRRAFRDVSNNVGRNNNNNNGSKPSGVGKPVVVKRTNGVKTRSMSNGGNVVNQREEVAIVVVAPSTRVNSNLGNRNDDRPPIAVQRGGRLAADPNSYQITGTSDDIDERDKDDPLCTTEYVGEMYAYFRERELYTSVRPGFMQKQSHINERMRGILVDWLVEVHLKFKLVPETLYLTVNLIDRYLDREVVSRPQLQLVGVTCLLIASKYEEIYPPELRDLVYICDRAYTKTDIIEMEERILKSLKYQITIPSAHAFLVRYLKAGHADKKIVQLSCFLMDGTLQSYDLLQYLPSQLAAAAVFISRRMVGRNGWSPTLLAFSDYAEEEVIPVARALLRAKNDGDTELRAVNKKYASNRYGAVSSLTLTIDF